MQDHVQTLAEVIREARVRARLSMRELARRSGLSAARISRIEAGEVERPSSCNISKTREGPRSGCAAAACFRGAYSGGEGGAGAPATGDRGAARAEQSRAHPCSFAARRRE